MEISYEQLSQNLKQGLKPVYLISSDEHLLLQEACQCIIDEAKAQGYTEKEVLNVERGFQWQSLLDANSNMSLFGEKKIIDLRIANGKPERTGSDTLIQYLDNASPDNLLLIRCPQLNKQSLNGKWIKAIKKHGVFCLIWKIKPPQLPSWIQQRIKNFNLSIERDAAQIIAERVEGNLLAAAQEIEKLSLIFPENTPISSKQVLQTVANSSRYDVYTMTDSALSGDTRKALQIFRGLREERTDLTIIAWALRKEIETLLELSERSQEQTLGNALKDMHIWKSKETMYVRALKRLDGAKIERLLESLAKLDKTIKGRAFGSPDDLCEGFLLDLAS